MTNWPEGRGRMRVHMATEGGLAGQGVRRWQRCCLGGVEDSRFHKGSTWIYRAKRRCSSMTRRDVPGPAEGVF